MIWFVMNTINILKRRGAKSGIEQPESVIQQTTRESVAVQKYKTSTLPLFAI
ncbi:hypothetical protein J2Y45_005250 [Dyadobacter sp. BE34]|uniref:Uncharacterized protein n=1 Tax=Dyadobacter fermentans TaxID=94254 RepID=A0ABU1R611_9BACT|nr:hypothetical protein [Dyadobacter fermentans]MDR7045783.1 hypothetical protein [Dyadobacter sp. BE242]MDR7200096.1 hypothetical protein [Dyadobacter sp. BE34]MDR7218056.1 hypothetical protein [Dyadobacter sp. BE31]MDR7265987.1 hypothetical protein [Dyadobacter sp. BE32]